MSGMIQWLDHVQRPMTADEIREWVGWAPLMLELGCHRGIDTQKFLGAMPDIRLFCWECEERAIRRFKELIGTDHRVRFYEKAAAHIDGTWKFHGSTGQAGDEEDWDYSGSLEQPTGHVAYSPEIKFKPPIKVPCMRLDTWLEGQWGIKQIDFAWVDVQGSQRKVLAGGQRTFPLIRYLYIECHETPLYEHEPTQEELVKMLAEHFHPLRLYDRNNIFFRNNRCHV